MTANNLLTPEEIKALRENGGTISKSFKDSPNLGESPKLTSVNIRTDDDLQQSANWGTAPRVTAPGATSKITGPVVIEGEDGTAVVQSKITAPNIDRYNKQSAKRQLDELNALQKANKDREVLTPERLLASLNAVDRRLRKLEKQLKEES